MDVVFQNLKVDPVEKKLEHSMEKRLKRVSRMEDIWYPQQLLDYRPIGQRPGLELKRRIQSRSRNKSLIGLTWWQEEEEDLITLHHGAHTIQTTMEISRCHSL